MELALNLEWMAVAAAMCWLWVYHARREGRGGPAQFVSLGLVLAILFVVITMYDDKAAAQNPAETRCLQRDDDSIAHAHVPFHPISALITKRAVELRIDTCGPLELASGYSSATTGPIPSSIRNRPPPAA